MKGGIFIISEISVTKQELKDKLIKKNIKSESTI